MNAAGYCGMRGERWEVGLIDIEPCPYCGGTVMMDALSEVFKFVGHFASCQECSFIGPVKTTELEAVGAHNTASRAVAAQKALDALPKIGADRAVWSAKDA